MLWFDVVMAMLLANGIAMIVGLIDAARFNDAQWRAIGQSRSQWLMLIMLVGGFASFAFWRQHRAKLQQVKRTGVPLVWAYVHAAGWYPDPYGAGMQRWYDGQRWTAAAVPMPPPPVRAP